MSDVVPRVSPDATPKWRPIGSLDRRVIGVLAEKAKTTPDQYPMTLNGLVTGCNQKSNRFPQMEVQAEDVEEALTRLREVGVVTEVQGGGRVAKYRHLLYEWLGVDKVELSVMTELLLCGADRGRTPRRAAMDPIPDLNALRPLLQSLTAKGLVVSLTPEGRGHVVTHALYEPRKWKARSRIRRRPSCGRSGRAGRAAIVGGSRWAVSPRRVGRVARRIRRGPTRAGGRPPAVVRSARRIRPPAVDGGLGERFELDFAAKMFAQRPHEAFHRCMLVVQDHHPAEQRVVDLALFGDGQFAPSARGLDLIGPPAAK